MVAPTGNDVASAWASALEARSGVCGISLFDASQMPVRIAAEVRNFDPTSAMTVKDARQSSRFVQFACAAALVGASASTCLIARTASHKIVPLP